eukprot:1641201-Alexandrium_andersonii.AAC.1
MAWARVEGTRSPPPRSRRLASITRLMAASSLRSLRDPGAVCAVTRARRRGTVPLGRSPASRSRMPACPSVPSASADQQSQAASTPWSRALCQTVLGIRKRAQASAAARSRSGSPSSRSSASCPRLT